jgi:hypothetical protein
MKNGAEPGKTLQPIVEPGSNEPDQSLRANLILLGDFNITSTDDVTFEALVNRLLRTTPPYMGCKSAR